MFDLEREAEKLAKRDASRQEYLKRAGSAAAPGYMRPEGVVVYHRAGNVCLKATIKGDEKYKGES